MRKRIILFFIIFCMILGATALAAELNFTPEGGGKWIYCNNPESIRNENLMNNPDYDSAYIMNNAHLTPDTYDFLLCHINATDTDNGYGAGYEIEVDVEITAEEDSEITINKAFFETPDTESFIFGDGTWYKEMHKVGCLNSLASFLGVNLCEMNGSWLYEAKEYEPVTVEVKKGDTIWLGEYADGYSVVPYAKPSQFMGEIELTKGKISFNVAAFKTGEGIGDRSGFDPKAKYGSYVYTRTQKGIADTLPKVNAYLEYTIDNTMQDGDFLVNKVHNQYKKDGFVTDVWCSHLNPQDDIWSKNIAMESDLLTFEYPDDSKLTYYGSKVKNNKKNNIWTWDPFHSDTTHYEGSVTWFDSDAYYYPNYELSPYRSNQGYACSMGNYCVTESYNLKVKNITNRDRYFEYVAQTISNIAVYVEDEDGRHSGFLKGERSADALDTMASVLIPADSEKEFTVNVILPINYVGGIRNRFQISDESHIGKTYEDYAKEESGEKGPSTYGMTAAEVYDELPEEVHDIINGNYNSYELIKTDFGYMLRYLDWDGIPYYFYNNWVKLKNIYVLDEDYNLVRHYSPEAMARLALWYDGYYYIEDANGNRFRTNDGVKWERYTHRLPLPEITFGDDEPSKWAEDEVKRAYETDVAPYDLKDKLEYKDGMTREIFCYVLSSMLERADAMPTEIDEDIEFTDTESKTIRKFATAGIISGYEDGTFRPKGKITRQEAAMLLYKTYCYQFGISEESDETEETDETEVSDEGEETDETEVLDETEETDETEVLGEGEETDYTEVSDEADEVTATSKDSKTSKIKARYMYADDSDIGDWAKTAVDLMHDTEIMQGVGGNRFAPKMTYTNEQSIATILRLFDKITEVTE